MMNWDPQKTMHQLMETVHAFCHLTSWQSPETVHASPSQLANNRCQHLESTACSDICGMSAVSMGATAPHGSPRLPSPRRPRCYTSAVARIPSRINAAVRTKHGQAINWQDARKKNLTKMHCFWTVWIPVLMGNCQMSNIRSRFLGCSTGVGEPASSHTAKAVPMITNVGSCSHVSSGPQLFCT